MTVSKHSEAQIIAALKQVEAGRTAEDVARECGVRKHTIYADTRSLLVRAAAMPDDRMRRRIVEFNSGRTCW